MQQNYNPFVPVPPRKRPVWPWVLGVVGAVILVALCVGLVNGTTSSTTRPGAAVATVAPVQTTAGAAAPAVPAGGPAAKFGAKHLALTVKITSKECFGSAGCLVEWSIRLATKTGAAIPDRCEITYQVTGLKDGPQIGTIVLTADGQYEQDEFQSGQTSGSKKTLAAKVTEVEC